MPFVSACCPLCGKESMIDPDQSCFYCPHCGRQSLTQAAISFYESKGSPSCVSETESSAENAEDDVKDEIEESSNTASRESENEEIAAESNTVQAEPTAIAKSKHSTNENKPRSYGKVFGVMAGCFIICVATSLLYIWLVYSEVEPQGGYLGCIIVAGVLGTMYRNNKRFKHFDSIETDYCKAFCYAAAWGIVFGLLSIALSFYYLWSLEVLPEIIAYYQEMAVLDNSWFAFLWDTRAWLIETFWQQNPMEAILMGGIPLACLGLAAFAVPYGAIYLFDWASRKSQG